MRQRLALDLPERKAESIWLHASSVGEVALLEPLVKAFEREAPDIPLLITAFTSTGISTARQRFPEHTVRALPFDFRFAVRRYVRCIRPRMAIVVESEFWPVFLSVMEESGVPVAVLNAKMSHKSMKAHSRTRFVSEALRAVSVIGAQDEENAERFRQLGVPLDRVYVTGNMKYDLVSPDVRTTTRASLGIDDGATVIIGGSLHEGEEEVLLDAIFVPEPVAQTTAVLLAPRYTEAAPEICAAASKRGLKAVLRTSLEQSSKRNSDFDVCVVDTLGELRSLYSIADVVFVGGSLFDRGSAKGGHNLMEPAIYGVPVLFGPFNSSFAHVARELESSEGGKVVRSAAELREALCRICEDSVAAARMGAAAREVVLAGQGGTARNLDLVRGLLEQRSH